ncbi:MAG: hypothetical protein L0154_08055 [Chloroflexi bacterium]|nr:hypothetical protein [Chloroflexota bacterium]
MATDLRQTQPNIIYIPPAENLVHQFVQVASLQIAQEFDDEGYLHPDVMYGLCSFIKLLGQIKAKQLNQPANGHVDDLHEAGYS